MWCRARFTRVAPIGISRLGPSLTTHHNTPHASQTCSCRCTHAVLAVQVAPGGRLPLPLRWCHTEDIRLRPLRRRRPDSEPTPPSVETQRLSGLGEEASQHTPGRLGWDKVGQEVMQREESGGAKEMFEFSDCSALVPAGR